MTTPVERGPAAIPPEQLSFESAEEALDHVRTWSDLLADRIEELRHELQAETENDVVVESLTDATLLLQRLSTHRSPQLGISDDGHLRAFWSQRSGDASLSLKFLGGGRINYSLKHQEYGHNFGWISPLPAASLFPWYLNDDRGNAEWRTSPYPQRVICLAFADQETSTQILASSSHGPLSFERTRRTRRLTAWIVSDPAQMTKPSAVLGRYFPLIPTEEPSHVSTLGGCWRTAE